MSKYENNTIKNTIIIISIYIFVSIAWILLSDRILFMLLQDLELLESLQTIKGIFYIIATAFMFYFIIKRRMDLYGQTINHLSQVVEALERSNKSQKRLEERLYKTAYYDDLTKLPSKNMIKKEVETHILEHENEVLGFVYLDIDNFRDVNEMLGHIYGDKLLNSVAKNFVEVFGNNYFVGRITGDEFIFLFKGFESKKAFKEYVEEVAGNFKNRYTYESVEFYITFSAGITIYPYDGLSYDELLQNADFALSVAKQNGKQQYAYYSDELKEKITNQIEITNQLHYGIDHQEFVIHYQPIVSSKDGLSSDVEALIRWDNPKKGFLYPGSFIEIAEKTNHMTAMTLLVIEASFKQYLKWLDEGLRICISINLSSKVIRDLSFVEKLKNLMHKYQLEANDFVFEITESDVIKNIDQAILMLNDIKMLGFKIALDDFGTGYSSLTYLEKLPIDILKIDRRFINNCSEDDYCSPILKFVINLAHSMKMTVVAEGIEDEKQFLLLKKLKADYVQGYYFSKPVHPDALDQSLFRHQKGAN